MSRPPHPAALAALAVLALAAGGARAADQPPSAPSDAAPYGPPVADQTRFSHLLIDQAEGRFAGAEAAFHWNGEAWTGTDRDRLWLKSEGEARDGRLEDSRLEAFYVRPISTYWNLQAGARADFGEGPGRGWAALGVEGLAPYWVRTTATAYAGDRGRLALRLEALDDLRLTHRLIAEPRVEAAFASSSDAARGLGAGLTSIEAGLRLRYEITPKFAPYVGAVWSGAFGDTAAMAAANGRPKASARFVAGLRVWF